MRRRDLHRSAPDYARPVTLRVATWNLFHGRTQPQATHADLVGAFADALDAHPWDVCGLQEVPPWWAPELGEALGASVRTVRTSFVRAALPRLQEWIHRRDPEIIGVRGAGANVLLIRPGAGVVTAEHSATLRWLPQRRTVHAVRLERPDASALWVANVHTHNKPESKAAADTIRALARVDGWSRDEPAILLGDLNLPAPQGVARVAGWEHLHGHRVDHVLGRGTRSADGTFAEAARLSPDRALSDHRIVGASVKIL